MVAHIWAYMNENLPEQSASESHDQLDRIQRPLDLHLKSDSGHGKLQFCSSLKISFNVNEMLAKQMKITEYLR